MASYRAPERLLLIKEAAELCRCSEKTIRRRIKAGLLPVIRNGRLVKIDPRDLAKFLNSTR